MNQQEIIEKLATAETRREVFEYSLAAVLAELSPERALLAYRDKSTDELSAQATHGLDPQTVFVAGEISTELIKNVMRDGKGMCLVDAIQHPQLSNRTSVILSGLRSIVCVPIVHASRLIIGLIYADNRIKAGAFEAAHQTWLEELAQLIAERLLSLDKEAHESGGRQLPPSSAGLSDGEWQTLRHQALQLVRDGQVEQAMVLLQQLADSAAHLPPQDPRRGKSLGELAELQRQAKRLPESERNFLQAIDYLEALGQTHRNDLAPVLTNLATLYFSQGNGVRAEGLYRRALEIWTGIVADDKRLAPVYFNLATLCKGAGATQEARSLFEKALHIAEKGYGSDHPHSQRCRQAISELA